MKLSQNVQSKKLIHWSEGGRFRFKYLKIVLLKHFSLGICKSNNNLRKKWHLMLETSSLTSVNQHKQSECGWGTGWVPDKVVSLPSTPGTGTILSKSSYLHHPLLCQREPSQPIANCFKPKELTSGVCQHFRYEGLFSILSLRHSDQGSSMDREVALTGFTSLIFGQKHWETTIFYMLFW